LLGRPPSTVHRVLARHGLSRLRDADRVTAAPIRYIACHPGALVHHQDGGLTSRDLGALGDLARGAAEASQVEVLELEAQVAPGRVDARRRDEERL